MLYSANDVQVSRSLDLFSIDSNIIDYFVVLHTVTVDTDTINKHHNF